MSLIIALPVVLWAASGFMHPVMTNIRPAVATQFLQPAIVDSNRLTISLSGALKKNDITTFHNFRFIHIDSNWFYQVQKTVNELPVYLSATTGKKLPDGDMLYARYIAKQFLEGQPKPEKRAIQYASVNTDRANMAMPDMTAHDCCDAATTSILLNDKGSRVTGVTLVTAFNNEYKFINRLLPVYKVNFNRADGIRIYVETTQDRFSFAMDNKRALFDALFSFLHTWEWMNFLGDTKYYIMILLTGTAFFTTLTGLYIFFTTKTKRAAGNEVVKARTRHRWTSLSISIFTLMFTGSGAFHAIGKLMPDTADRYFTKNNFAAGDAHFNLNNLQTAIGPNNLISNISMVKIDAIPYWQVFTQKEDAGNGDAARKKTDLMKAMAVQPPSTIYVKTTDYSVLPEGEEKYAAHLAASFSRHAARTIKSKELVTKFAGEYGFVNKRLPVWKVMYDSNRHERFYIETATGKLAAHINDENVVEGYSFALFHKHEFMAWAGKPVKDFSTMFWAGAQIAMVAVGLLLYFKMKKRKKQALPI